MLKPSNLIVCVITDTAVNALAEYCPDLLVLDLSFCNCITDAAIRALADSSHHLMMLFLENCKMITGLQSMAQLASNLSSLRYLSLMSTTIAAPAVEQLCSKSSSLKFIELPVFIRKGDENDTTGGDFSAERFVSAVPSRIHWLRFGLRDFWRESCVLRVWMLEHPEQTITADEVAQFLGWRHCYVPSDPFSLAPSAPSSHPSASSS